jgi:hypothetical protein
MSLERVSLPTAMEGLYHMSLLSSLASLHLYEQAAATHLWPYTI